MIIRVRVMPNSPRDGFDGMRGDEMVLRISAPAVDGKANAAAIAFLARYYGLPRSAVRLTGGEKSRHKKFELVGLEAREVEGKPRS